MPGVDYVFNPLTGRLGLLDRVAIGLSGLCVAHCVTSAVLFAMLATAGGLFSHEIHAVGLMIAIALGVIALGVGIVRHGYMMPSAVGALGLGVMAGALALPHNGGEMVYTLVGVGILALGHDLNRRATS